VVLEEALTDFTSASHHTGTFKITFLVCWTFYPVTITVLETLHLELLRIGREACPVVPCANLCSDVVTEVLPGSDALCLGSCAPCLDLKRVCPHLLLCLRVFGRIGIHSEDRARLKSLLLFDSQFLSSLFIFRCLSRFQNALDRVDAIFIGMLLNHHLVGILTLDEDGLAFAHVRDVERARFELQSYS